MSLDRNPSHIRSRRQFLRFEQVGRVEVLCSREVVTKREGVDAWEI